MYTHVDCHPNEQGLEIKSLPQQDFKGTLQVLQVKAMTITIIDVLYLSQYAKFCPYHMVIHTQ